MMYISAENRNWHTLLAVDHVLGESLPISKKTITLLRHFQTLFEQYGALHWRMIMEYFEGFQTKNIIRRLETLLETRL